MTLSSERSFSFLDCVCEESFWSIDFSSKRSFSSLDIDDFLSTPDLRFFSCGVAKGKLKIKK